MKLTLTSSAIEKINELNKANHNYIWLYYDTDDCGCGVSGMPSVRLTNSTDDAFESVENDNGEYEVIIHKQQAVFFANQLTLDHLGNSFRLSSPEGILNPIIPDNDLVKGVVV
ncbi:iron-sulfur cluster biosynthesis family protein [Aquibacillus rhizosphaerae]|uniref:Iron-sulfur cluster biosynthesis family protein n=1 Tax=Aquibacillus rhizosphaerae TaxID=3051431 RepID=A0ABT7L804_9BACI|nr:iron-sulfur cluster biosynthesis family protein [Aquibacillus sp. LR5S19]MDL4840726.1 iron-sulfur cluster biosynthesis family protein [Aquibacillus sp. LR5S19]